MPPTTFVARRPEPFSALVQAAEIGGLRLEPRPPVRVTDRYYDTDTGDLLRSGLALRVREHGGRQTATLQAVEGDAPAVDGLDLGDADGLTDAHLTLPPGPLARAVHGVTGGAPLLPLLSLRQYRTPRVARDAGEPAGLLSFNVVVYEAPGEREASREVEVEPRTGGLLARLAPAFVAGGLELAERSSFARAVLRHPRGLSQPVLLLPDEVRALEGVAASSDLQLRRRASVVLLDARGFRPDTIAAQTGMSMTRVRYWRQRFREIRLGVLEREAAAPARRAPERPTAPRPPEPSAVGPAPTDDWTRPPAADAPPEAPRTPSGDGLPDGLPQEAADMAELLELFRPGRSDTPLLDDPLLEDSDDDAPGDESAAPPPGPRRPLAEAPLDRGPDEDLTGPLRPGRRFPAPRLNPYPVVLGPVPDPHEARPAPSQGAASGLTSSPTAGGSQDPFAEIDLQALRFDRDPEPPAAAPETAAPARPPDAPPPPRPAPGDRPAPGVALDPAATLLEAARLSLAHYLDQFEARADAFRATGAPSDARRLFVAAQRLRLTAETFAQTLPPQATRHLVAGLRPLANELGAGLDAASRAVRTPGRVALARLAVGWLATAATRLDSARHRDWRARAHRLLDHLDRQRDGGVYVSDFAEPRPGGWAEEAPTHLRHVLGSAVWARFEAIRAFESRLEPPSPGSLAQLAVALSALQFVLRLAEPFPADLAAALHAADCTVTRARHGAGAPDERAVASQVWAEIVGELFRQRLAAVVAAV